MGHVLHAVIGHKAPIAELAAGWWRARRIDLPQDFALVPLTAALHDDIVDLADARESDPFPGFERLSAGMAIVLENASRVGPLAYIETDYFGGVGRQMAVAWQNGKVLLGPLQSETVWTKEGMPGSRPVDQAINRVLAAVGVWTQGDADRFDTLGLGKFRITESCAEKQS